MTKRYRGDAGGYNINVAGPAADGIDYGIGFGQGDLRRALREGYSPQSIASYVYGEFGGAIGDEARANLDSLLAIQEPPPLPAYQPPNIKVNVPPPAKPIPAPMSIKGNAAGVKKKKSKAEMSGRVSSGTSQFNRNMFISPVAPLSNLNV